MKINISNPTTGSNKQFDFKDESKYRIFYDYRLAQEVDISSLDPRFKGYIVKLTGGCDFSGFPMLQGVLVNKRVRLLLNGKTGCFYPRRSGERKRRSIRGCIVGPDISVLHCIIVKKGEKEIEGLTDKILSRRLGPKRASNIRKLYNLDKDEDVRKFVVRRKIVSKEGKSRGTKAPKIQRLVTPQRLQRKARLIRLKKEKYERSRKAAEKYEKLLKKLKRERMAPKVKVFYKETEQKPKIDKKEKAAKKEERKEKKAIEATKTAEVAKKADVSKKVTKKEEQKGAIPKKDTKVDMKSSKKDVRKDEKKPSSVPDKKPATKKPESVKSGKK